MTQGLRLEVVLVFVDFLAIWGVVFADGRVEVRFGGLAFSLRADELFLLFLSNKRFEVLVEHRSLFFLSALLMRE